MNKLENDNIMLVTYHPLNDLNGGTVMYKTLIENFPSKNLFWIGTGAFLQKTPEFIKQNCKDSLIVRSFIFSKNWIRVFSRFPFNIINTLFIYFFYAPRATIIVLYNIKKNNIKHVWFESFRQTYLIAYFLLKFTNVKVHLSFNDHYSAHCRWPETKILKKLCQKIVSSQKTSFDFISRGMLDYFIEHYNFISSKFIFLWVGNSDEVVKKAEINQVVKKIIFYGSIHGLDVFYSFCEFIASQENNIVLDIYSGFDYSFISNRYKNVNFCGQLSQKELGKKILDYDLAYVPIYFDEKNKTVMQTSLSSKMILAINSGIPIFSHAPSNSANSIFISEFNLGFLCPSLQLEKIASTMGLANNFDNRLNVIKAAKQFSDSNNNNAKKALELYNIILL